ncbi:MAG TPA: hypothetical protein VFW19_09255 [Allosphingosinicella sp.]|nr:hypothetical protein [Allosphingosinicella sp.]
MNIFHPWKAARLIEVAALAVLASGASSAGRAPPHIFTARFMVDADEIPDEPTTTRSGQELTNVAIRHPRAVKLVDAVDAETARAIGASADYPLEAGQVLVGLSGMDNVYCAPLEPRGIGTGALCLVDEDGDGRFDAVWKAGSEVFDPDAILINRDNRLVGVHLSPAGRLPHPIAYAKTSYRDGPAVNGHLFWRYRDKDRKAGAPGPIIFWLDASDASSNTEVRSRILTFAPDKEGEFLDLDGLRLHFLGFDRKGALRWEAIAAPGREILFGFGPAPHITYMTIYR